MRGTRSLAPAVTAAVLATGTAACGGRRRFAGPGRHGNALVTRTDLAEQDPDLVQRFRAALLQGLAHSVGHPDETGQILVENQPAEDAGIAAAEVELMAPAVGTGDRVGSLDRGKVQGTIDILVESGGIEAGLTPDDVVSSDLVPAS